MAPVLLTESADRWRRCYLLSRQMICTVVAPVLLTKSADRWRRCYLLSRQMICTVVAPVLLTESADRWRRCYLLSRQMICTVVAPVLLSLQIDGASVTYWVGRWSARWWRRCDAAGPGWHGTAAAAVRSRPAVRARSQEHPRPRVYASWAEDSNCFCNVSGRQDKIKLIYLQSIWE